MSASEVTVDGLAEMVAAMERDAKRAEKKSATSAARLEREFQKRLSKLEAHKANKNPQILLDTLRQGEEGELVNGKEHKGWVVEIECATCSEHRLVNTQDAFQVKFCSKACKPKASVGKRTQELSGKSEEELLKMKEELEARLAAAA